MPYICPICAQPLSKMANTWGCEASHRFDCAKEGYVNLLPVQKKNSKDPGDNQQMMFARREFLNAGYYQHLSDRVNELALVYGELSQQVLDIGCGEGYYSHRLYEKLHERHDCQLYGVDISRSAIRYAAKRYPALSFCVASAYDMPFADNSFDLALRIYAPSKHDELTRLIRAQGLLITVAPGPKHHYAIKKQIYAEPRFHPEQDTHLAGFNRVHVERLQSQLSIKDASHIGHFLEMTPYAWKLTAEQKLRLIENGLECELDFQIEVHQRVD